MASKAQGKGEQEAMQDIIARDERRKERERLASAAMQARRDGVIRETGGSGDALE